MGITAGRPDGPRWHMLPSSPVDFDWFIVFESSHFPCLKTVWNCTPYLLVSACYGHFGTSVFSFLNYILWLRLFDESPVPERCKRSIYIYFCNCHPQIHLQYRSCHRETSRRERLWRLHAKWRQPIPRQTSTLGPRSAMKGLPMQAQYWPYRTLSGVMLERTDARLSTQWLRSLAIVDREVMQKTSLWKCNKSVGIYFWSLYPLNVIRDSFSP